MTAGMRGWWRRLTAAHVPPWRDGELDAWIAARDADREAKLIGPVLPPGVRVKAEWSLLDRQNDPALAEGRMIPLRVWHDLPH